VGFFSLKFDYGPNPSLSDDVLSLKSFNVLKFPSTSADWQLSSFIKTKIRA